MTGIVPRGATPRAAIGSAPRGNDLLAENVEGWSPLFDLMLEELEREEVAPASEADG